MSSPSCSLRPCVFHRSVLPPSTGSSCVLSFGVEGQKEQRSRPGWGGSRMTAIWGWRAVAVRFLRPRGTRVSVLGGYLLGVRKRVAVHVQPLGVGGRGRCQPLLCAPPVPEASPACSTLPPPCPVPTSQDRPEEDAKAPRGVALWSGGPAGSGRGLHLPHPTPATRGLILSRGALTVLQFLTDSRVPHGASCYEGQGAAAGLRRLLRCLPCVQPRAGGQRAEAL